MSDKGIWKEDQEKLLAKAVDNAYQGKGILELVDGYVAKVAISIIDDTQLEKLPEDLKPKLSELTDLALAEDVEGAEKLAAEILNARIDIPGIDEEAEYVIFEGALTLLVGAVIKFVKSKKEA